MGGPAVHADPDQYAASRDRRESGRKRIRLAERRTRGSDVRGRGRDVYRRGGMIATSRMPARLRRYPPARLRHGDMLATVPQGTRMPRIVHQLGMAEPVAVSCSVQDLIANPGGRLR